MPDQPPPTRPRPTRPGARMRYFPVFLDLQGKPALVVGTGEVATRKTEALRRAGACVKVTDHYQAEHLAGCAIAVGADAADPDLAALSADAQRQGIPVNIVDRTALCSFISPAIVDRAPLLVAISSAGTAPVLARLARARIEAAIPPRWGRLAALAERFKNAARQAFPDMQARRRVLESALDGPIADLVLAGREAEAAEAMARLMHSGATPLPGFVHLIPVRSPEADLLTLRAQRIMGEADWIIHDPDIPDAILDVARRDAHRFMGNPGEDIAARMIALARDGHRVARLSWNDPPGHEQARLHAEAIPFAIIPAPIPAPALAAAALEEDHLTADTMKDFP